MAEKIPQTYENHKRLDPTFHIFIFAVLAIQILLSLWNVYRQANLSTGWQVLFAIALLTLFFKIRLYALRLQDRIIRLEERLRLAAILSDPLKSRIHELEESQWVALRFASDEEVSALVDQTLKEKLSNPEIKKRIRTWRPDTFRV